MPKRSYLAGWDSGGTHTTCALATPEGEVVAIGHGGPGNLCTHPRTAPQSLRDALSDAMSRLPEGSRNSLRAASVGCAGYFACGIPDGPEAALDGLLPEGVPSEIVSDIEVAFSGAAFGEDAVVLIAGTGAVAYGGTREGDRARAGGWGYLLSDEGSAFWIGLQAVRAALQDFDGRGPHTSLTSRLCAALRVAAPEDLEGAIYGMDSVNTGVAALASSVMAAAREGDEAALHILNEAGRWLAESVVAVMKRLDRMDAPLPVATVGGVLQDADSPVRQSLVQSLSVSAPNAEVTWPRLPPVGGALLRAGSLSGLSFDESAHRRLQESLDRALHPATPP